MNSAPPRRSLLAATALSTLTGLSVFAWDTWWVWWDNMWPFTIVAVSVLALVVAAPISVGLSAVRSSPAGPRVMAARSGRLAATFVVPAALVTAASKAWPYVLTPRVRAALLEDFGAVEGEAFIAAAPSPIGIGLAVFAALIAAGAAAWGVVYVLALVLRRVTAHRQEAKSPQPQAEGLLV